jgi:hypothetical protein
MRAEELRIGNYLDGRTGFLVVEEIRKDGCRVKIEDRRSSFIVCGESPCLTPISLTEEWLLKFGFEKSGLYHVKNQIYIHDERGWTETGYEYRFNYNSIKIEYVHTLQNLYFALTGTELTLNETR